MDVHYNDKADLLYIRLDRKKQSVINKRVSEDVVVDVGKRGRIVGIEILAASKHVDLPSLFPVRYKVKTAV